jgi:hypothetical protein
MSRRLLLALALTTACAASFAQTLTTYTQNQTGPGLLAYGLPVPVPIESLTPVDGFRSYASLEARLQGLALGSEDLFAHQVGQTFNGRPVWAYVVGDADGTDVEGRPEAAFFINAVTHAREWAAPEVSTGTIERLVAGADDGGLVRYLLDNTRLVIIPVQNIDGFLQTQRYPTQVIVGGDPDSPAWPRDGRMRRKNMRGVDEVLTSFGDRLGGIDLNRNHPPFWATSTGQGSSSNPNSLTYHGTAPQSEPEALAIVAAAELGPASRMRLGIDLHSFSRVFFSSNTARTRLNSIQTNLIQRMRVHHLALSGKNYDDVRDPPNLGIGTAAEYFAYTWLVPAWTLELEPQNSPVEYGGFNVNHGGFILPASEARRVRESWAETHAIGFYLMAGPAHLSRLRMYDVASGALAFESRWQYDASTGLRTRSTPVPGPLQPARRYRAELAFSKPMRYRDAAGQVSVLPGSVGFPPLPSVALLRGAERVALDTSAGTWINDPARVRRYKDDTFAFEFDAPADIAEYRFEIDTSDMTGLRLDADPSTPVDWAEGAWSQLENADGVDGDFGGADSSMRVQVQTAAATQFEILTTSRVAGEGDALRLRVRRTGDAQARLELAALPADLVFGAPTPPDALWLPGESGERSLEVRIEENLNVGTDRTEQYVLHERVDGEPTSQTALEIRVLDNDAPDEVVRRIRGGGFALRDVWVELSGGESPRHAVLDGNQTLVLPREDGGSPPSGLLPVNSQLSISGNGAVLAATSAIGRSAPFLDVSASGQLSLDAVRLDLEQAPSSMEAVVRNAGRLTLSRSEVRREVPLPSPFEIFESTGELTLDRVRVQARASYSIRSVGGNVNVGRTTFASSDIAWIAYLEGGSSNWSGTSLIGNTAGFNLVAWDNAASAPRFGHGLIQDNFTTGMMDPPTGSNCLRGVTSLGYNIEDRTDCGFAATGDRSGLDLGEFELDESLAGFAPRGAAIDGGATSAEAEATGCGRVDQRGAPRPQTLTPGAVPRCDVGAIELGVNPYRGIWSPERAGHGLDIQTAGNSLFLAWYTYADDGQPTAYQAIAQLTGPRWEADLMQSSRNPQSGQITTVKVGRVTLDFDSDVAATFGWRFDARGVDGSERIAPARFGSGAPRFEVTGLWYAPADSGYGATISRRGEATAIGIYYYDAQGTIRWALGTADASDAVQMQMTSFTGFCPDCDATTNPVVGTPAGTLLAHFQTPRRARLDMELVYPGANGGTWNRQQARFVPINDLVDNRGAAALLAR